MGSIVIGDGLCVLRLIERACNVPFVFVTVANGERYCHIERLIIHGLADVFVSEAEHRAFNIDDIQHVAHVGIGAVFRIYAVHAQRQHPFC